VAAMKEPQVSTPNRKGRSMVNFGGSGFYIDGDEMRLLRPFLDKITEAIRAAR
jgi:hypothetical protein